MLFVFMDYFVQHRNIKVERWEFMHTLNDVHVSYQSYHKIPREKQLGAF